MANPIKYIVEYIFSGFQANNPKSPLPAPKIDNEFANIAQSLASVISAVGDTRRSDGALKNGIVTFDSLALALQLMLKPSDATLVANAVAAAQAAAASATASDTSAGTHETNSAVSAAAAAASASTVNLALYLAKANNLAGLGSQSTSRSNLGLGTVATFDVGAAANNIVQLDAGAKIPAYDGSQITNIDILPIGATVYFSATTPPAGFIKENGALLTRADYPRLWTFANASGNIVTEASWPTNAGAYSTGDLVTTFRIPDARGEFFRSFDDSRGVDSGRVLGANQADSLKDHTHPYREPTGNNGTGGGSFPAVSGGLDTTTGGANIGGAETRPRNIAKLACIKAY